MCFKCSRKKGYSFNGNNSETEGSGEFFRAFGEKSTTASTKLTPNIIENPRKAFEAGI